MERRYYLMTTNKILNGGGSAPNVSNYLTIVALEDGLTASLSTNDVEYSIDGNDNWTTLSAGTASPAINKDQYISFRGTLTPTSSVGVGTFTISKSCDLAGNCMSLLFGDDAVNSKSLSGKSYAFYKLFYNCSTIKNVSTNFLPATTLASDCYEYMFYNCTSLTTAPELPTTTLVSKCYQYMFYGCSSLTIAPELPATKLSTWCYSGMFTGCSKLVIAPKLPATSLSGWDYLGMFSNCTSLVTAPSLPATNVGGNSYSGMFKGCVSLKNIPSVLPATSVGGYGYASMFEGCISLTTAPSLSFTTVNSQSCQAMFKGCTSLKNAPSLKPTTLAYGCYRYMFSGCSSLTTAPALSATTLARYCYEEMFRGCSSLTGAPKLPATTLESSCYSYMFYGCTSLTSVPESLPATTLAEYCYENMFQGCSSLTTAPLLPATTLATYCYNFMFSGCKSLTTTPELPATTMSKRCYQGMFSGTSIINAPELPATTLADGCYVSMFNGCTKLINAPELPATRLRDWCYENMFANCLSLIKAPKLPAKTLSKACYLGMFQSCTSLTTAPDLMAKTLVSLCYYMMFYECTNLNYIKAMFTTTPEKTYTSNWVNEVASSGTFVKNIDATWDVTGEHGIPSGWTVILENLFIPQECMNLSITADDISGRKSTTTVYYTATVKGLDEYNNSITKTITGTDTVEIGQNTSTTNSVIKTVSYTYMGVTATTTITQGPWVDASYTVNLNNQWQLSSTISNPDSSLYEGVYQSYANKGTGNSGDSMYIDIDGYTNFKLYIRSYAESSYDYVMVSQLDKTLTYSSSYSDTTLVKAHTRGNQKSGTTINDYTLVEFTNIDGGSHRIQIIYRKDSSANSGDDRGYVLIPKNQ